MPSRRGGDSRFIGISKNAGLMTMVSLGVVRSLMNCFSFTWTENIQQIWNLPGPEPSFSLKYNIDYWIKNILSLVLLFRNFTTHLHLIFYLIMLYPLLTGKEPRLMLPWLYLQMLKNIVTDFICATAGVLLCLMLHSSGLLALEFLIVQIISTMPSIFLWRRLRAYYLDLYYAELDAEYFRPQSMKVSDGLTLAQRRRATRSLDGGVSMISSADNRTRGISCFTYEEFFGPTNWQRKDSDDKISKSLTTLLTVESQESDDVEEDNSRMEIIDIGNLTPAEKTLKILGLTRDKIDRKTSVSDFTESAINAEAKVSQFSVEGNSLEPRTVGIQARPRSRSKPEVTTKVTNSPWKRRMNNSRKCECCETTRCSEEHDADSQVEEDPENRACCDRNRENKGKLLNVGNPEARKKDLQSIAHPRTTAATSGLRRNNVHRTSGLQAAVERDGIAWDNLKEINFVSVINKSLCGDLKQSKPKNTQKTIPQKRRSSEKIVLEKEDEPELKIAKFRGISSASFVIEANVPALNAARISDKSDISQTQRFEPTSSQSKQLIRADDDTDFDSSYFKSNLQRNSNMFDDTRAGLLVAEPLDSLRCRVHSSIYQVANRVNGNTRFCEMEYINSPAHKVDGNCSSLSLYTSGINTQRPFDDVSLKNEDQIISEEEKNATQASQTSDISFQVMGCNNAANLNQNSEAMVQTEEQAHRESTPKESFRKLSSRSSKVEDTLRERESKEMEALKAYNERTLLKYKRKMEEIKNSSGNQRDRFRSPFSKLNRLYAPSVPELEKREKDLISKMESSYGRFARSKLSDQRKEYFSKMKVNDKTGTRKQHSKYSKLTPDVVNEADVTPSRSCKRIEGSRNGRELERSLAKENIRARNVEVYYLERQRDDEPTTSKKVTIKTIKSFSQKNKNDFLSAASSHADVSNNPEGVPSENNDSRDLREVVKNIDWSFQGVLRDRVEEEKCKSSPTTITRDDVTFGRQDIVLNSTEKILQAIFSHSENSARGFRLGESANEFYPIFNTVSIAMKEIVRAAALRGFRDDFLSQPSTEIEIPELSRCEITRSSSREFLRCNILPDTRSAENAVTSVTAEHVSYEKQGAVRREKDSLDRDETTSLFIDDDDDETYSDLLRKLVTTVEPRSAEVNIPIIRQEDVLEKPEDDRGNIQRANFSHVELKNSTISSHRVRSTIRNPIYKIPDKSQIELSVPPNQFDARGKEIRRIVNEFFHQFPNFANSKRSGLGMQNNSRVVESAENEETGSTSTGTSSSKQDGESENTTTQTGTSETINSQNVNSKTTHVVLNGDGEDEEDDLERRVVAGDSKSLSPDNIGKRFDDDDKFLLNSLDENAIELRNSEIMNREYFRREVISSAFVKAIKIKDNQLLDKVTKQVDSEFFTKNYNDFNEIESRNSSSIVARPDTVLKNIEIVECAIKKMKDLFEDFFTQDNKGREKILASKESVAALTNFKFPINGELEKLQNLIQMVTNYVTISKCPSAKSIDSFNEIRESDDHLKIPILRPKNESDDDFAKVPETMLKNSEILKSNSSRKFSQRSKSQLDRFSSWDKVIPPSTKLLVAKNKQKNKSKRVLPEAHQPVRRLVKVVKLVEEENADFLSARSVPQRGRGLSSGYLMDSDSDGNFTISRPLTPDSIESETSRNLSQVFSTPPQASEIFPHSDASRSIITERPIESEEYHVLGIESLSTSSDLRYTTSLNAAGIENRLKDVVQQILSHKFSAINRLTNGLPVVSNNTSFTSITIGMRTVPSADLQTASCDADENIDEREENEDDCRNRIKELLAESEDAPIDQLVTRYRGSRSGSGNSGAISIEALPRNSRISLKHVAIGTEYSVEVFKELLEIFSKICPMENQTFGVIELTRDSNTSRIITRDDQTVQNFKEEEGSTPKLLTTSYDSFVSTFSRNIPQASKPICQTKSISNDTFFEEFPEQIDAVSNQSGTRSDVEENSLGDEISVSNSARSDYPAGSSKSEDKSKRDSILKKRAIPRPLKNTKERKL